MSLRGYQETCLHQVRANLREGRKRIMVFLPTGAGKTHIFMHQVRRANVYDKRVLILVRRRQIVFQTARRIAEFLKFKPDTVGVFMGAARELTPVTVASVDTAIKHLDEIKPETYDVVIVDECHDCTSNGYQMILNRLKGIVIGYTATPFRVGRKGHKYWEAVVRPIKASQLRDEGYLVPTRIYCPSKPDLSKVAVVNGEYNQAQLDKVMRKSRIYGDIAKHFDKVRYERSAIAFCTTIEHSKELCEALKDAGIDSRHVDATTPQEEREAALLRLQKTNFVLCNVNVFSTGVDVPECSALILARPTKSLILYLQQVGRGLRPSKGKRDLLIHDHAGNCLKFGSPYNDFNPQLDDMGKGERTQKERNLYKDCQICAYLLPINAKKCPECGHDVRSSRQVELDSAAELIEYKGQTYTDKEMISKMRGYMHVMRHKLNYPESLVLFRMRQQYGQLAEKVLKSNT